MYASHRIVCLVPSITELLYDLGLEDYIFGVTKFCVHPPRAINLKKIVGGTKNVSLPIVKSLLPTIVIASKEENIKKQVDEIAKFSKVILTDVKDIASALKMIVQIGLEFDKLKLAKTIVEDIKSSLDIVKNKYNFTACYLIWKKPYMTIGNDTYIHAIMNHLGIKNVFTDHTRYPTISNISEINAEYILLSSEPYPFQDKDIEELKKTNPNTKIILVDGEIFSWYGTRMLKAEEYFREIISLN
jgi:ABC-type Fe3+-hydroxamate transport system substrate-binding protein